MRATKPTFGASLLMLAVALALPACDSQLALTGLPAIAPTGGTRATLTASAAGTTVTIDKPATLPDAVRSAADLKVAIGKALIAVTRDPGGYYAFTVPPGALIDPDVAGAWKVAFVMDDVGSQIVTLQTGSPVLFADPPVLTKPGPAFLVRGLELTLTANTRASAEGYQFAWSYATSGTGPWLPISGQGKVVSWTPPTDGNYFVKVDAVDRATRQSYSTVTPSALVFVTDGDEVITTTPTSGAVERGGSIRLAFNRPTGLAGGDLDYAWSSGPSPQGPWTLISGNAVEVAFQPTTIGSYYIKTEVSSRASNRVNTFITPDAAVFVDESRPIVTAKPSTAVRGERVALNLNLPLQGRGAVSWFYSRTGVSAQGAQWTLLNGTGVTNSLLVNESGTYSFRVDVPDANGAIKTFTTTEPVLSVTEGKPIVTANPGTALRGDRIGLTLNLPAEGPLNWYYGKGGAWSPLTGTDRTNSFVVNEAGTYDFRVDVPDADGAIKTFTTTDPVLNVSEGGIPLVTSDPPNASINRGSSVKLVLNARGVDEANYRYIWYVSTSLSGGWSALPVERARDLAKKIYDWDTVTRARLADGGSMNLLQPAGSYFVRVDASEKSGSKTYTFTSSAPVVTIEN